MGTTIGYGAVNFPYLQEKNTNFPSGPLTLNEATLFMSLNTIGGIFGLFIFAFVLRKIGSRNAILFLGIPQMV